MKKLIIIFISLLFTLVYADSLEYKTGSGERTTLTPTYGGISKYSRNFPYVCYDVRVREIINYRVSLKYTGCTRVNVSCRSVGRAHFGKYPNDLASYQAYKRCKNAKPRFTD